MAQLLHQLSATEDAIATTEAQTAVLWELAAIHDETQPALAGLAQLIQLDWEARQLADGMEGAAGLWGHSGGGSGGGSGAAPVSGAGTVPGQHSGGMPESARDAGTSDKSAPDAPRSEDNKQQAGWRPSAWWPFSPSSSRDEQGGGGGAPDATVTAGPTAGTDTDTDSSSSSGVAGTATATSSSSVGSGGDERTAHTRALLSRVLVGWEGADACEAEIQVGG